MKGLEIDFDLTRIDRDFVIQEVQNTQWGKSRSSKAIVGALENSVCGSAFIDGKQVGFVRAVTDRFIFAYLADIFVTKSQRNKGIGTKLLHRIISHPDLSNVTNWILMTRDAHSFFLRLGFSFPRNGRFLWGQSSVILPRISEYELSSRKHQ